MEHSEYRGRFAPSPTGPLHFGSLIAAVGSYLDAKSHQGQWLVRIEDLDTPRTIKGAADNILRTLEAFGLHWDESVLYQSQRTTAYEDALLNLQAINAVYPCACTRKEISDSALHGIEGQIYPGTCRNGIAEGREGRALRVRTNNLKLHSSDNENPAGIKKIHFELPDSRLRGNNSILSDGGIIQFDDALKGLTTQHLESEVGDFVVKRADGLFAYQFAVVVDDAFQGITNVVRGADLLTSTPRQILLQRLLGLSTPAYMHLPVAINVQGEKLSKQTLAPPVDTHDISRLLSNVLAFLQQQAPADLASCKPDEILKWAIDHWDRNKLTQETQVVKVSP